MIRLTLPVPQWQRLVREAWSRPRSALHLPVSLHRRGEDTELLAVPTPREGNPWLHVRLADSGSRVTGHGLPEALGVLALSRDGRMAGAIRTATGVEPLYMVFFPGPGMYRATAISDFGFRISDLSHSISQSTIRNSQSNPLPALGGPAAGRWSRTIGALGADVWSRLVSLHYSLVGLGRTGSQVALGLARLGVQRLTLVDADRVEPHNLGEMVGVTEADVGRLKVEALADACRQVWPEAQVEPCSASITTLRSLLAVRDCDLLLSCADHDAARLATATIATAYHRVLVDVGTGVLGGEGKGGRRREGGGRGERGDSGEGRGMDEDPPPHHLTTSPFQRSSIPAKLNSSEAQFQRSSLAHQPTIGLDVRLLLPADRCLLCLGGVRNPTLAHSVLQSAAAERAFFLRRDWQRERAGSLWSLNQIAAGLALRLLEDLVAGRITESTWLHLEYSEDGIPSLQRVSTGRNAACPLCASAGRGEEGLAHFREVFSEGLLQSVD